MILFFAQGIHRISLVLNIDKFDWDLLFERVDKFLNRHPVFGGIGYIWHQRNPDNDRFTQTSKEGEVFLYNFI